MLRNINRLSIIKALIAYETKKNIKRKIILTLLILCFIVIALAVVLINYMCKVNIDIVRSLCSYKWYTIMSFPQFFISIISIAVGGGLFSIEYENHTSNILYSKPLGRMDIFIGKFLGGFIIISAIILSFSVLSILTSYLVFNELKGVIYIPIIIASLIYSQLTYYSLSYMFSQILKRTNVSIIVVIAIVIIGSLIVNQILNPILIKYNTYLKYVLYVIPSWAAGLPTYIASKLFIKTISIFPELNDPLISSIIILIYTVITSIITIYSLMKSNLIVE